MCRMKKNYHWAMLFVFCSLTVVSVFNAARGPRGWNTVFSLVCATVALMAAVQRGHRVW
jgi:hypothetical protein